MHLTLEVPPHRPASALSKALALEGPEAQFLGEGQRVDGHPIPVVRCGVQELYLPCAASPIPTKASVVEVFQRRFAFTIDVNAPGEATHRQRKEDRKNESLKHRTETLQKHTLKAPKLSSSRSSTAGMHFLSVPP